MRTKANKARWIQKYSEVYCTHCWSEAEPRYSDPQHLTSGWYYSYDFHCHHCGYKMTNPKVCLWTLWREILWRFHQLKKKI